MILLGMLFLLSSRQIKNRERVGIKIGQTAIGLLILTIIGFAVMMVRMTDFMPDILPFRIFFSIMMCVVFGQFLIPTYYGIRYLHRLPIEEKSLEEMRFGQDYQNTQHDIEVSEKDNVLISKHKEALLPFGVGGSFFLLMACLMIPLFAIQKFYGMELVPLIFIPGFILIFFGPMVYNSLPSSFEKGRKVIASFTGGGSIFLFNGSWPFFRRNIHEPQQFRQEYQTARRENSGPMNLLDIRWAQLSVLLCSFVDGHQSTQALFDLYRGRNENDPGIPSWGIHLDGDFPIDGYPLPHNEISLEPYSIYRCRNSYDCRSNRNSCCR